MKTIFNARQKECQTKTLYGVFFQPQIKTRLTTTGIWDATDDVSATDKSRLVSGSKTPSGKSCGVPCAFVCDASIKVFRSKDNSRLGWRPSRSLWSFSVVLVLFRLSFLLSSSKYSVGESIAPSRHVAKSSSNVSIGKSVMPVAVGHWMSFTLSVTLIMLIVWLECWPRNTFAAYWWNILGLMKVPARYGFPSALCYVFRNTDWEIGLFSPLCR